MPYILSIDSGTTTVRALIYNHMAEIIAISQQEITLYYPQQGWVEQDAIEIYEKQLAVCISALEKANLSWDQIATIGIANQRETTVMWDKNTGMPIYNAIVWQDNRTLDICDSWKNKKLQKEVMSKTGLVIDTYFSATKIKWLIAYATKQQLALKNLLVGTIDTWLIWNLTQREIHATDTSNASRTMLYNIHTHTWDINLCQMMNIPTSLLPEVKNSADDYGFAIINNNKIKINSSIGDQQAALYGHSCYAIGDTKNTYGTGCFILMNTGKQAVKSNNGLLTTIAWTIQGETTYALEGSVFHAGSVIQWLRDELKILQTADESERIAETVSDNGGVVFVPAFSGLGSPYWKADAKGIITGLQRSTSYAHIVRAALESIALQNNDVLRAMQYDSKYSLSHLKVDGGGTQNTLMMQMQADIAACEMHISQNKEITSLGAAKMAALYIGISIEENKNNMIIKPSTTSKAYREQVLLQWQKAIASIMRDLQ